MPDGTVRIELTSPNYSCQDVQGHTCNYRFPRVMQIKNVNLRRFQLSQDYLEQLKLHTYGYDEGFLPVTPDGRLLDPNICTYIGPR